MRWMRKAAENGNADMCVHVAQWMYADMPYAREVGHVEEATGIAASVGVMEGHDVPPEVMTDVVHWLRKAGHPDPAELLDALRRKALKGGKYCRNEGCEVVGHLKDFKVCPQERPVLRRRVPETGLDDGWAQGGVWQIQLRAS